MDILGKDYRAKHPRQQKQKQNASRGGDDRISRTYREFLYAECKSSE